MATEQVFTCPFCNGQAHLSRPELLALLNSRDIRAEIEKKLASTEPASAGRETVSVGFEKDVHSWNPQLPIWRRSPKE